MKYIVIKSAWPAAQRLFDDFETIKCVSLFDYIQKTRVFEHVFESHVLGKLKWLPLKRIWLSLSELNKLPKDASYVFIFLGVQNTTLAVESGLVGYLKRRYPGSKFVGYYIDIHNARRVNIELAKETLDLLYIFDEDEANKMGIECYPLPFSKGITSDLMYVGQDKGRLEKLIEIYDYLENYGVKCFFYLSGVPLNKQIKRERVYYGGMMDYDKSLYCLINSNCVLELCVGDVSSYSDRVQKAIAYGKKVLTNNPTVKRNRFYDESMFMCFDKVTDIKPEFFKDDKNRGNRYGYVDEYSPVHFLEDIDVKLDLSQK